MLLKVCCMAQILYATKTSIQFPIPLQPNIQRKQNSNTDYVNTKRHIQCNDTL